MFAGGPFQHSGPSGKEATDEILLIVVEVGGDQAHGRAELVEGPAGVFVHHMDLEVALGVMGVERSEIGLGVASGFRCRTQPQGHGLAKDGEALLEIDDPLLVHEGQRPFGGGQRILQQGKEEQVALQPLDDRLQGELDQETGTRTRFRRNPADNNLQRDGRGLLPHADGLDQRFPVAVQQQTEPVVADRPDGDAAPLSGQPFAVPGQAVEDESQAVGRGRVVPPVEQQLIELAKIEFGRGL